MVRNVGSTDAALRGVVAAIFLGLAIVFNGRPVVALTAAILSVVLAATALTRECPLYRVLGTGTQRRAHRP